MQIFNGKKLFYLPLEEIILSEVSGGSIKILDGAGDEYLNLISDSSGTVRFTVGGGLGTHTILESDGERLISTLSFSVATKTGIKDSKNVYAPLLQNLYLTMVNSCGGDGAQLIEVENKLYHYFICWLRDHTHTMKGMKYFFDDVQTGFELYADTQRADGMVYDRIRRVESDAQNWRDFTFREGNFARIVYSNADGTGLPYTLQRIPVENDVEFLFLECLYFTWKACGSDEWMIQYLDNAIKAVQYATTAPYRWSEKYQLLKRGYTIDTWDFMHDDDVKLTLGDNVCDIDKTTFGVMFGDNTGMAVGCLYLAEMLEVAGRKEEAEKYQELAEELFKRLDEVAWNGEFYTHHVSEDPSFKRDVGNTDESAQVTLSNAYSVNRGIGIDKAREIIKTYQRIRQEMPAASPGEFYNCYPPFEKGFGKQDAKWQYMNGGVSSIVAGELARGAFCSGEEAYGADILQRIKALADRHEGHLHVCFNGNPQTVAPPRNFKSVKFVESANIGHVHNSLNDWGDPHNDLKNLPRGDQEFAGIPFQVGDKGIGFKGPDAPAEIHIPVSAKFASLYFLHTMNGSGMAAEMEVCYANGETSFLYIENGRQLRGWFMPASGEIGSFCHAEKLPKGWPEFQLAWQGGNDTFDNVGTYLWGWDNPYPEREITEIILRKPKNNNTYLISGITGCDQPVWFPQSDLSFGIPDSWGAAAVVYALLEGLAGVIDTGVAFDKAEVSPRWCFTGEDQAEVVVKYEASGGYVAYSWQQTAEGFSLLLTSSATETIVRLSLRNSQNPEISVNGKSADFNIEDVGESKYAKLAISGKGVFKIKLNH